MSTEELPEVYALERIEQLRAIADELRQRIIRELMPQPRTVTQVADTLGLAPAKVHYHMRELERVGLVKLVFTREKAGILEKYFQPIARSLLVEDDLLQQTPPQEYIELASDILGDVRRSFMTSLAQMVEHPREPDFLTLRLSHLWITGEEFAQFLRDVEALEQRFKTQRGVPGEREVSLVVVANEPNAAREVEAASAIEPTNSPEWTDGESETATIESHRPWAAGAFKWDAADLEAVLERGERLDIAVLGVCTFGDDVSADLAERAISQFNLHGKLVAPPEVRAVLKTKEAASPSTTT